jgi:hypothetical protein
VYAIDAVSHFTSPDLFVILPMTRIIQTAMIMFPQLRDAAGCTIPVQMWPNFREPNDTVRNSGFGTIEIV